MLSLIMDSINNGFIKGGYIERPVMTFVDDMFPVPHSSSTQLYKNATRLACIWFGFTLAASTVIILTSVSKPCSITSVGLMVFAKPLLWSIHDFNHEIPSNRLTWRKVSIAACWLLLIGMNAGLLVGTSRKTSWVLVATAGLLASNLTVDVGLCNSIILSRPVEEEEIRVDPQSKLIKECAELRADNIELKFKIEKLDQFIKHHPDLLAITQKYLAKYQDLIGVLSPGTATIKLKGPDDYIAQRGQLHQERIRLEHELNERMIFIQTHEEVYDCFKKNFNAEKDQEILV